MKQPEKGEITMANASPSDMLLSDQPKCANCTSFRSLDGIGIGICLRVKEGLTRIKGDIRFGDDGPHVTDLALCSKWKRKE